MDPALTRVFPRGAWVTTRPGGSLPSTGCRETRRPARVMTDTAFETVECCTAGTVTVDGPAEAQSPTTTASTAIPTSTAIAPHRAPGRLRRSGPFRPRRCAPGRPGRPGSGKATVAPAPNGSSRPSGVAATRVTAPVAVADRVGNRPSSPAVVEWVGGPGAGATVAFGGTATSAGPFESRAAVVAKVAADSGRRAGSLSDNWYTTSRMAGGTWSGRGGTVSRTWARATAIDSPPAKGVRPAMHR